MTKKGKKRRKREASIPQEIKSDLERPSERNKSVEEHVCARSDDVGPSDQCREPSLEPKHKIFLSHSGAQKDFTWQLCEDLERVQHYPFFDRRDDSLPKGEKFPPLIIEAARKCCVAVLVISDEFFTRSKWPMIELNEFVKAQGSNNQDLKILPLFLGITVEQFQDKKRQAHWLKKWKEFAYVDKRIDVEEWEVALSKIPGGINVMKYYGAAEGEVEFRRKVVAAICKLLPRDVKYDVSHVQSSKQLCEPIKKKLKEVGISSRFKVKVVGLYGMGGVGKTTISRFMCNEMFDDFGGKVCHVELGGHDQVELKKRVLREVTYANASIMENDSIMLDDLLIQRMHRQEVFLVLDNVWDDQVDEAKKYLNVRHHAKSMVLVTSRSIGVLIRLGIEEFECMEMSNLVEEGAIDILLHYSGISREDIEEENEWEIVQRCVMKCYFSRGELQTWHLNGERRYHPLALKVLGDQLVTTKIKDWNDALKGLDKFNVWKDKVHPVFSILGLGFDALQEDLKAIFLDLALIWRSALVWCALNVGHSKALEWEWLCTLHSISEVEMIANVKALQRKGLLENVNDITKLEYNIHDLYYEFAKAQVQVRPFKGRRILFNNDGIDIPQDLKIYPPNGFWPDLKRVIILRSEVKSLQGANLHHCKNVEVLVLIDCHQLEELDVTGMDNLRLMVVLGCVMLCNLTGLNTLTNLVYFSMRKHPFGKQTSPFNIVIRSTKLRVVRLYNPSALHELDLVECKNLHEVVFTGCFDFTSEEASTPIDIGKCLPTSIQKLDMFRHRTLASSSIHEMAAFSHLQDLNLCFCKGIHDLKHICEMSLLKKLIVSKTEISNIPNDLGKLKHLQYLDVSECTNLTSIVGIVHATALHIVLAHDCKDLREAPHYWSGLEQLEVLDLRGAPRIRRLPKDFDRFRGPLGSDGKLKVKVGGCWGLIVPLVQKLRGSEVSRDACVDGCICDSSESMGSWVVAKKNVNVVAYNWLEDVLGTHKEYSRREHWTYLLDDDDQVIKVLIRGLCEHDVCGRLTSMLKDAIRPFEPIRFELNYCWWVVVATAPCTFKVVTEGAMMEPWKKTLLHYTIVEILPQFLSRREQIFYDKRVEPRKRYNESNSWFLEMWYYRAMVVVLQKCKEKLVNAGEHGVDPIRCNEGMKLVNTFLRELEAAKSEKLHHKSILNVSWNTFYDYFAYGKNARYNKLYPFFQFESTLATETTCLKGEETDAEESDNDY